MQRYTIIEKIKNKERKNHFFIKFDSSSLYSLAVVNTCFIFVNACNTRFQKLLDKEPPPTVPYPVTARTLEFLRKARRPYSRRPSQSSIFTADEY